MSEINGNRVEINRTYLPQVGEAESISIVFQLYFYCIHILTRIPSSSKYAFNSGIPTSLK